jgi:predicted nicotinamide N-methyase
MLLNIDRNPGVGRPSGFIDRDSREGGPVSESRRMNMEALVREGTRVAETPICPEIRLHLSPDMADVWERAEEALGVVRVPPPLWSMAWVGGQALARYILDTPDKVAKRRVLDVGSGSGLCAIAAAKAGAALAVANDPDPLALTAIRMNATLNAVPVEVLGGNLIGCDLDGFDVILAGDLWYERLLAQAANPWLRRLAGQGCEVLVADRRRAYFPRHGIEVLAQYDIPTPDGTEQSGMTGAGVWRLLPDDMQ